MAATLPPIDTPEESPAPEAGGAAGKRARAATSKGWIGTQVQRIGTAPLAQRFTVRYGLAVVLFALLAAWTIASSNRTLDAVEEARVQLEAISAQAVRVQSISMLAIELTDSEIEESDKTRAQVSYVNTLAELRDVHLGLSEARGDSGLAGIPPGLEQFWQQSDLDAEMDRFITLATDLQEQLAATASTDARESTLRLLVSAADPSSATSLTATLESASAAYAEFLDSKVDAKRGTNQLQTAIFAVYAGFAVFVLFRPMAKKIQEETNDLQRAERIHRENNDRQIFRNKLKHALEPIQNEEEIFQQVGAALVLAVPNSPAELMLIGDNNKLTTVQTHPVHGGPGCPVEETEGCVAIRAGNTIRYDTSRALDVCPKLREHEKEPCSAVCVPIRFTGNNLGVLHTIGADMVHPSQRTVERLNVIADEVGNRLGTYRATKQMEEHATTDGLTGLPNRRKLEQDAHDLIAARRPFAVAMADLDHFKRLNDTYGHEAGDRALRLFAKTLRANLRPNDIAARYGGEEFVLLLPSTGVAEAQKTLDRLRIALAGEVAATEGVQFTASWGLTTSDVADSFDDIIAVADKALYEAKEAGRNRVVVRSAPARPEIEVEESEPPSPTSPNPQAGPTAGASDGQTGARPAPAEIDPDDDMRFLRPGAEVRSCPTCGASNAFTAEMCMTCGERLPARKGATARVRGGKDT